MKIHPDGFKIMEKEDFEKILQEEFKRIFVFDKEFRRYDFITDIYIDGNDDLIIEIGGDA